MDYPVFKPELKDSYTILVPDMLPVHFKLIINILKKYATINQELKAIVLYMPQLAEYIYVCLKGMEAQ